MSLQSTRKTYLQIKAYYENIDGKFGEIIGIVDSFEDDYDFVYSQDVIHILASDLQEMFFGVPFLPYDRKLRMKWARQVENKLFKDYELFKRIVEKRLWKLEEKKMI